MISEISFSIIYGFEIDLTYLILYDDEKYIVHLYREYFNSNQHFN